MCVDEQMALFKDNSYNPKKPHKRAYMIFILADDMGKVYDFMPCVGKIEPLNNTHVIDLAPSDISMLHLMQKMFLYT